MYNYVKITVLLLMIGMLVSCKKQITKHELTIQVENNQNFSRNEVVEIPYEKLSGLLKNTVQRNIRVKKQDSQDYLLTQWIDNDSYATVHEPLQYYVDADKDGFGSNTEVFLCSSVAPEGYAINNTDCNDSDATVHEPILYYIDADHDGFGSTTEEYLCSSVAPEGYATNNLDCDDSKLLYADNDQDGLGAGGPVACGVENNNDCDDTNPNQLVAIIPDVYALNANVKRSYHIENLN